MLNNDAFDGKAKRFNNMFPKFRFIKYFTFQENVIK